MVPKPHPPNSLDLIGAGILPFMQIMTLPLTGQDKGPLNLNSGPIQASVQVFFLKGHPQYFSEP